MLYSRVKEKKDVYILLKTLSNPFFNSIQNGAKEKAGSDFNLVIRSGNKENDIEAQIQSLQTIINEAESGRKGLNEIGGVIITPTSSKNELIPYLKHLNEKKIPIILVDTKIDSNLLSEASLNDLPIIASSNTEGGIQAGKIILNNIQDGSKILILNGVDGQETAAQRNRGFHSILDTTSKKINLIVERTANWNRQEALKIVSSFYSGGERFDAIFGANDEMALGALQAILNSGVKEKPIIVGFDATDEARESVNLGGLYATIAQNPYKMGEESILMLKSILENRPYNSVLLLPTEVVKRK